MERNLLIVDDEPLMRLSLTRTLADPDYAIFSAATSTEALEQLARTPFKVVISDHHLRGETGTGFLALLERQYPHIARILLTGDTSSEVLIAAVDQSNARRVLYKPWDNEQLRGVVRQCFGLPRRAISRRARITDDSDTPLSLPAAIATRRR